MDSDFDAPPEHLVITQISKQLKKRMQHHNLFRIETIVKERLKLLGGSEFLGNLTTYHMYTRYELFKNCFDFINKHGLPVKHSLKSISFTIIALNALYKKNKKS